MDKETVRGGSKIAENTAALAVCGAGSAVLMLVQLGILSRYLSNETFGLFVVLRGFALILSAIVLAGLPMVLIRFLPSYQSRGEKRKALRLFSVSVIIVLVMGAVIRGTSAVWLSWIPSGVRELAGGGDIMTWLALASAALALKMLLYSGFNGLREMRSQMVCELSYLALLTGFIVVMRNNLEIILLFKAICILNLAVFAAGLPVYLRFLDRLIPAGGRGCNQGIILPAIMPYWAGSVILSFVALAFTDVDRFVMSSMIPVAAISLFHVASRINVQLKRFLGFPVIAAQPEITRVYEEGRWDELAGKIAIFTKATFIASLFGAGLTAVIGRDIILLLSGQDYQYAYRILLILLVSVPIAAFAAPHLMTMKSLHFMKWAVLCDFLYMAVYFGTFYIFVSLLGVMGMAVAQVVAQAVQMTAAVALSRKEGFYGGMGGRIGRVLAAFCVLIPAGVLLTTMLGWPASVICLAASPFVGKLLIDRLDVFEPDEKGQILDLLPVPAVRRAVVWFLSVER